MAEAKQRVQVAQNELDAAKKNFADLLAAAGGIAEVRRMLETIDAQIELAEIRRKELQRERERLQVSPAPSDPE